LPGMGERVDGLIAAVDAAKVGESVDNVHRFATALGGSSEDVQAIVAEVRATAERFNALSQRAESLVAGLDDLAGEAGGGLLTEVRHTLDAIRVAAENFGTQAESISGGINQFTSRGLRELQDFVGQGRRAASRLERVITNMERDPGQFLFGGEGVPEYSGGRRR
jgi:phospholipid/cholesterol/gamma-HCH transport system substrate-binding protein